MSTIGVNCSEIAFSCFKNDKQNLLHPLPNAKKTLPYVNVIDAGIKGLFTENCSNKSFYQFITSLIVVSYDGMKCFRQVDL